MAVDQEMMVHAWKDLSIQVLVLLSLTVQVVLLVLAEFRRSLNSGTLKIFVWSAYMLADGIAIYVLGHMSVVSRSSEHQLVAFWAPFLLLHLGGQDNITAYAIEDNSLWLRHLQTLAVQVATAAYVVFNSSIFTGGEQPPLLRCATILMFMVGGAKYGERVWALWSASRSSTGNNYHTSVFDTPIVFNFEMKFGYLNTIGDNEYHMIMAHNMLEVPYNFLKESIERYKKTYCRVHLHAVGLYKVVEMQLSLMHDIFYSKASLIGWNYWYVILIRKISTVATATALVLFHRLVTVRDDDYDRIDVAVTYVLLVGAIILEVLSLLRATFSSWTYSSQAGDRLVNIVLLVRRLVRAADWRSRYWSGSMGQHNLLKLSACSRASQRSMIARRLGLEDPWNTYAYSWSIPVPEFIQVALVKQLRLTRMPADDYFIQRDDEGQEGVVPDDVIRRDDEEGEGVPDVVIRRDGEEGHEVVPDVVIRRDDEEGQEGVPDDDVIRRDDEGEGVPDVVVRRDGEEGHIAASLVLKDEVVWKGQNPYSSIFRFESKVTMKLKRWRLYNDGLSRSIEERILTWHIATNIYLTWWYKEHSNKQQQPTRAEEYKVEHSKQPNAELAEALSNYMVFLVASRPDMISPTGSRRAYVEMCYALARKCKTAEELAGELRSYGEALLRRSGSDLRMPDKHPVPLRIGCKLGAMLIQKHAAEPELIAQVWLEILYDAAQGCSVHAHAKQLSNGGELITVAAILVEYSGRTMFPESPNPSMVLI